jgi:hypothetical protein
MVIPDIFNRESILAFFRMDPHYQPVGMTPVFSNPDMSLNESVEW